MRSKYPAYLILLDLIILIFGEQHNYEFSFNITFALFNYYVNLVTEKKKR
jgi:hypothetical protein